MKPQLKPDDAHDIQPHPAKLVEVPKVVVELLDEYNSYRWVEYCTNVHTRKSGRVSIPCIWLKDHVTAPRP